MLRGIMKRHCFVLITALGCLVVGRGFPQANSSPAAIVGIQGAVYLDGKQVTIESGRYRDIEERSLVQTYEKPADVLLALGATLHLADNSGFRLLSRSEGNAHIQVVAGSASVVMEEGSASAKLLDHHVAGKLIVDCEDTVKLASSGKYHFRVFRLSRDSTSSFCEFKVYDGAATVQLLTVAPVLMPHEMMVLSKACGDHVQIDKFDGDDRHLSNR